MRSFDFVYIYRVVQYITNFKLRTARTTLNIGGTCCFNCNLSRLSFSLSLYFANTMYKCLCLFLLIIGSLLHPLYITKEREAFALDTMCIERSILLYGRLLIFCYFSWMFSYRRNSNIRISKGANIYFKWGVVRM